MAKAMDAFGDFIAAVAAAQNRATTLGELGLIQTAFDFALAGVELSA